MSNLAWTVDIPGLQRLKYSITISIMLHMAELPACLDSADTMQEDKHLMVEAFNSIWSQHDQHQLYTLDWLLLCVVIYLAG